MSRSRKKTPIFGWAGHSEKKDKRIANRMFRKKEKLKMLNYNQNESIQHIAKPFFLSFFLTSS